MLRLTNLLLVAALHLPNISAQDSILESFEEPFLFSYGSWKDKASTTAGVARIRDVTNQGGAGRNAEWNLADQAELVPVLRVRVFPKNQTTAIALILKDDGQGEANWWFELPKQASDEFVEVFAREGAPLSHPNHEGKPALAKIRQAQLIGNWAGGTPLDIEVDAVLLKPPTTEVLAARAKRDKRLAEEAEKTRQEQKERLAQYGKRTERSPTVEHVSMVAPNVMAIEVQAGTLVPAKFLKYVPQPGDEQLEKKNNQRDVESVLLKRDNQVLGWLIGPGRDWLTTYEAIQGDPLLDFLADDVQTFKIRSSDDATYATPKRPVVVGRKSHVNAWAQGPATVAVRHTLYLRLANEEPLTVGKHYIIDLGKLNTQQASLEMTFDPAKVRSEAVHVNQIGYRPDDPAKLAMVSCWLGTAGVLELPDTFVFAIVDDATGKAVFQGKGERHFPASRPELMARDVNFNGTDVARCDFSDFLTPGRYRVVVKNVGCSYPFEIGRDVWKQAFLNQMRGLYHQRSGVALGPPHSDFRKPRDMHPADGYAVRKTKYRAVENGGEDYAAVAAGDTGEPFADGWGGYHDAGDWNPRRVTHMRVTMAMLEMLDQFPEVYAALKLDIPKTKGQPDLLTEALVEFECFERLQQSDGGVGFGLESKGDPRVGEVSWLNSFASFVLAPDYAASWYYAAVGARLSRLLKPCDESRADEIRQSAIAAFEFAEADYAQDHGEGLTAKRPNTWQAIDDRNLAALELYHLTGEPKYHELFLLDSVLKDAEPELFAYGKHVQREHAFHYARLPDKLADAALNDKAARALSVLADRALNYAENNAFNVTTCDKGKPQFIGFYTAADAIDLTRAHYLTGEPRYLAGAVRAMQFQSGCNPNNLVYMTGIGKNPVKNVFKLDARRTGQAVPAGLVPYGNIDFGKWNHQGITWPITWVIGKATVPNAYAWPTHQAYWDLGGWPMLEEFTVDAWSPNVLVWGYLAARP